MGGADSTPLFDPAAPLTATGNLRRRELVSRSVDSLAVAAAVIAVAALVLVVASVVAHGAGQITWSFLTTNPPPVGGAGGIGSAIVGTVVIVAIATVMAVPVGVLLALYLTEFAGTGRSARLLTLALDLTQGLPTIVVGIFVFGLMVAGHFITHGDSGLAASVALAIIMLPLIARSSQGVLLRVPSSLREAGDSLGVSRWRTVVGVVLPGALPGIITGTILSVARAAGETAPIILVDSLANPAVTSANPLHALPTIPYAIFSLSEQPVPNGFAEAWGAALVLMVVILVANVGARLLLAASRRRSGV